MQLPDSKCYDTQMVIHSATSTTYISLAQEFQKHLSNAASKHRVIDKGMDCHVKENSDVFCDTTHFPS